MQKLITLTLLLTASLVNAQMVTYEFSAESNASNTVKNNFWGMTAEGTVTLDQGAQTITVNIFNTSNTGNISGFDFYDPTSAAGTSNSNWNLTSATTANVNLDYAQWWDDTSEVRWLGDGSYSNGVSDKFVGAEASYNTNSWRFINAKDPVDESMTFVFEWNGAGGFNMEDLENAWDVGDADLRLRFQNVNGGSSNSAWHYDKFSTDLTRSVPEPSTYGMIGASALMLLVVVRRFKK